MNAQTPIVAQPGVYSAIAAIQAELAKTGIAKNRSNTQQNYAFRGIDDVYAALSPLLAKHGLCIMPRMVARERSERVTIKPGYKPNDPPKESVLFYVTVEAEFDFIAASDGTMHTVRTFGEAMDSGDKATNKAMSAAYKYAALMAFAIPTEGDNDADGTTHEVAPEPQRAPARQQGPRLISDGQREILMTLAEKSGANMKDFCTYYKIGSLPDLPADAFNHAKQALERKLRDKDAKARAEEELGDSIPY